MNSSSETTQTNKANKTGGLLESFVENLLKQRGYVEFWDHKEQVFANRKSVGGKQYAKQVIVGETIYETKCKCDFLVLNKDLFPDGLVIECKWQESKGSVDVKYPMVVFNILKIGVPTIVLLDGGGYSPKAEKWLRGQAHATKALIGVYNMQELQKAVNNGFLG